MNAAVIMLIVFWTPAGLAYDFAGFSSLDECRAAANQLARRDAREALRLCLPPGIEKELP